MYISVSDLFLANVGELQERSPAVRNLISAFGAGYHHLVMSRELIDAALQVCDLTDFDRLVLVSQVRSRYATARGELRASQRYVEATPALAVPDLPVNAVPIPLRQLDEPRHVSPTRIVVENVVRDKRGLEMLLHLYRRFLSRGGGFNWEFVNGGGATTADTFRHLFVDPRPVLCVVDSDRRTPSAPVGTTAAAVLSAQNEAPFRIAQSAVLPVRELENAIPLRAIKLVYAHLGDGGTSEACQKLIDFCEARPERQSDRASYVAFLDLKSGLKETDITAAKPDFFPVLRELWMFANGAGTSPEPDSEEFLQASPFSGISQNILSVVVACFSNNYHVLRDVARNVSRHPYHEDLVEFFELMLDFCAAPQPLPIGRATISVD